MTTQEIFDNLIESLKKNIEAGTATITPIGRDKYSYRIKSDGVEFTYFTTGNMLFVYNNATIPSDFYKRVLKQKLEEANKQCKDQKIAELEAELSKLKEQA